MDECLFMVILGFFVFILCISANFCHFMVALFILWSFCTPFCNPHLCVMVCTTTTTTTVLLLLLVVTSVSVR